MSKQLEFRNTPDGGEVWVNGELVGTVRRLGAGDYTWHSRQAIPPMHQGRCTSKAAALAHLGFRLVRKP